MQQQKLVARLPRSCGTAEPMMQTGQLEPALLPCLLGQARGTARQRRRGTRVPAHNFLCSVDRMARRGNNFCPPPAERVAQLLLHEILWCCCFPQHCI